MIAGFFIRRPIFAAVLSILIVISGGIAVVNLPLTQYPPVTPPTIQVDCNYPGAGSKTVSETIASPIEQQVNGVEGMLYMTSQCTSDGSYTLTVAFQIGTDLNLGQVLVQNRVNLALPNLPDVVRATGVTTRKRSPEILLTVSLTSPEGSYDQLYLSNYAVLNIREEMLRIPGISDVLVFGQRDYSMRIWVDPEKLSARNLSANDVVNALREQNAQVAAGQLGEAGGASGAPNQAFQLTITTLGRLTEKEEFEQIVVKATPQGQVVKLRDVARVELGSKSEDISSRFDGKPTIGLAVFLLPDANALETSGRIKAMMADLSKAFPSGMVYEFGYDTTPFIYDSIMEVFKSLRDAIILVAIVVLIFLQSWRAALIPLCAVPVAIIGTFAALLIVGFSLNNLTLFGLVLAVGIVVDDAIVVVEAVQHHIEKGLAPREATFAAMEQVTGPIIAVGLVLAAVFIPCAFLSGLVGQFFRQFALTIAVSSLISAFNSLTLSPALAALLLRPAKAKDDAKRPWWPTRQIDRLARGFNRGFDGLGNGYVWLTGKSIRLPVFALSVYGGLLFLGYLGLQELPKGFIPSQDKGYLIASMQLPDASSAERTAAVIQKIADIAQATPGVKHVNAVAGNSFVLSAYGSNFGSMFVILKGFEERQAPGMSADAIMGKIRAEVAKKVPEALVNIFGAPAVPGVGRAGGFRLMVQDRGDLGPELLQGQTDNLIEKANQQPGLQGLFTVFKAHSPQVFLDVDRTACRAHGLELHDVYGVLQASLGARYVNDFNLYGRTWQVKVQAESPFRDELEDVKRLKVRNHLGEMVPLGAVLTVEMVGLPQVITRYNMYPSAAVNGNIAPGVSSGFATAVIEQLAEQELASKMGIEWTELTFLEKQQRDTGLIVFGLSVVFVFLVLAALYESWVMPLAVILVVPVCVTASLAGVFVAGQDVNIFTQIGFVVLIGLACKNAILIVEFAKAKRDAGADRYEAVLAACRLRFRPIIMTSVAFILGVTPLITASGAGSEMREALGVAVFSGMIGVTVFGILLTPVFFVVIDRALGWTFLSRPWVRRVGAFGLDVVSLRFVRRGLGRVVSRRPR